MDRLCVTILGTFASGKSTLARGIIDSDGGGVVIGNSTVTRGGTYTFAGAYDEKQKYPGVDRLRNTQQLYDLASSCNTPVFVFEGRRSQCFGLSFLLPFFALERQLALYLKAPKSVIEKRMSERSGKCAKNTDAYIRQNERIVDKLRAIGVKTCVIDASRTRNEVLTEVLLAINKALK